MSECDKKTWREFEAFVLGVGDTAYVGRGSGAVLGNRVEAFICVGTTNGWLGSIQDVVCSCALGGDRSSLAIGAFKLRDGGSSSSFADGKLS